MVSATTALQPTLDPCITPTPNRDDVNPSYGWMTVAGIPLTVHEALGTVGYVIPAGYDYYEFTCWNVSSIGTITGAFQEVIPPASDPLLRAACVLSGGMWDSRQRICYPRTPLPPPHRGSAGASSFGWMNEGDGGPKVYIPPSTTGGIAPSDGRLKGVPSTINPLVPMPMEDTGTLGRPRGRSPEEDALIKAGVCTVAALSALDALAKSLERIRDTAQSKQDISITFYRGVTYYDGLRAQEEGFDTGGVLNRRQLGRDMLPGLYVSRNRDVAAYFGYVNSDPFLGSPGQGSPALMAITLSQRKFDEIAIKYGVIDNRPVSGLPFDVPEPHVETLFPYSSLAELFANSIITIELLPTS